MKNILLSKDINNLRIKKLEEQINILMNENNKLKKLLIEQEKEKNDKIKYFICKEKTKKSDRLISIKSDYKNKLN